MGHVSGLVDRAPDNAKVMVGGERLSDDGFFYAPTVVGGLEPSDEMATTEIFGPVITVQPFSDEDEALRWANGTEYGLASSVWTSNHKRALRVSRALDFGCVWINCHIPLVAEMPHGGFKQSGYGKDLSMYSLEEYTRVKHVMSALGACLASRWWTRRTAIAPRTPLRPRLIDPTARQPPEHPGARLEEEGASPVVAVGLAGTSAREESLASIATLRTPFVAVGADERDGLDD